LRYWYDKGSEERERCGQLGCEFVKNTAGMSASKMAKNFEKAFSDVWENWKPKEKYTLEVI
jgi:hypothetical protein